MLNQQVNKEALFNEVKGSLFEYLVARKISCLSRTELEFVQSIDQNYLNLLSQQDRMIRQFYPEMLPFLNQASEQMVSLLCDYLNRVPRQVRLVGKFSNSPQSVNFQEADLILDPSSHAIPLSLKLNKKNSFVNTKSGGIKSFFSQYFPFIQTSIQAEFNHFVDMEFNRMSWELHRQFDMDFPGDYGMWVRRGLSELPGELDEECRQILKDYYSRIAAKMHLILSEAFKSNSEGVSLGLPALMGFSSDKILQAIYYHEFPENIRPVIQVHSFQELKEDLNQITLLPFRGTASVEISLGNKELQIRVKPMNKFTTTAIKINCSVKQR